MTDDHTNLSITNGNQPAVNGDFTLPLGATQRGRLLFSSGAANVHIDAHPDQAVLYAARFERHIPRVWVQEEIITIQYHRFSPFDWLASLAESLAKIALNQTIPWEIEFRSGISQLTADLRDLQLCALDLCSVSAARITLPVPVCPANIYLSGSASDLVVHRPAGVEIRLQIAGSVSRLTLDGKRVGAVGGGLQWQTPNYQDSSQRYDIDIAGSVSNMTIGTH
jgi:hypothetical protein